MSKRKERREATTDRKPEKTDVSDLIEDDDNSINQHDLAKRAVVDATKAFERFADELN